MLAPSDLGFTRLISRGITGSIHKGLEAEEHGFERLAAFYSERGKGAVGLTINNGIPTSQ